MRAREVKLPFSWQPELLASSRFIIAFSEVWLLGSKFAIFMSAAAERLKSRHKIAINIVMRGWREKSWKNPRKNHETSAINYQISTFCPPQSNARTIQRTHKDGQ
jgi:hypothetical protein